MRFTSYPNLSLTSCSQTGLSLSLSAPLSHVIVNCWGVTGTEKRGRRKDQGLCFGDKYSWSSVTTFTWSPFEARTAVTLPQPFPEVAHSTTAPWDRLLQQDETPPVESSGFLFQRVEELHAHYQHRQLDRAQWVNPLVLRVRSWPHREPGGNTSLSSLLCSRGDTGGGSKGRAVPSPAEPPSPRAQTSKAVSTFL